MGRWRLGQVCCCQVSHTASWWPVSHTVWVGVRWVTLCQLMSGESLWAGVRWVSVLVGVRWVILCHLVSVKSFYVSWCQVSHSVSAGVRWVILCQLVSGEALRWFRPVPAGHQATDMSLWLVGRGGSGRSCVVSRAAAGGAAARCPIKAGAIMARRTEPADCRLAVLTDSAAGSMSHEPVGRPGGILQRSAHRPAHQSQHIVGGAPKLSRPTPT